MPARALATGHEQVLDEDLRGEVQEVTGEERQSEKCRRGDVQRLGEDLHRDDCDDGTRRGMQRTVESLL